MELVDDKKCCFVTGTCGGIPCLKQVAVLWSVMAVLVISMDLLSFAGLLPFPGGYTFPVIAFLYFTLGPRMCSIFTTLGNCLTPAVLFLLMNIMIVSILLSSGCFSRDDMSSLLPVADQASPPEDHKQKIAIAKSRNLSRSTSAAGAESNKPKVVKKVKRQFSAPNPSRPKFRDDEVVEVEPQDHSSEVEDKGLCLKEQDQSHQWQQQQRHSSSLIIMELPSEAAAASAKASSLYSSNLMTCDQDVFNQIIGNYIDKFKQDIRQQEMNGHHHFSW